MFTLWLACQGRLSTKDHLKRFGIDIDEKCLYCGMIESYNHLLFECEVTNGVWKQVLAWMEISHNPSVWDIEMNEIYGLTKGKWSRRSLLK